MGMSNEPDPPDQPIHVSGSGAAASDRGVAAGAGGIAIGEVHGDVTVIVQGENLRDRELVYLDSLLKQYEYWEEHYTPLAGIAEVRAEVAGGPRLDLPMPFIPTGFEKLVEHGYGERTEVRREHVDDQRIIVGDNGYNRAFLPPAAAGILRSAGNGKAHCRG